MKRQAHDNAGRLFDVNGPSSLGTLPRPDTLVRKVVYREYYTSPVQQKQFPVGAITRTALISTEMLDRGHVELRRRQEPRKHSVMEDSGAVDSFTRESTRNVLMSDNYISETEKAGQLDFEYRATNVVKADEAAPPRPSGRPTPPPPVSNANVEPLFTNANNQSNGAVNAISSPNVGPSQLPANLNENSVAPPQQNTPVPNVVVTGNGNSSGIV